MHTKFYKHRFAMHEVLQKRNVLAYMKFYRKGTFQHLKEVSKMVWLANPKIANIADPQNSKTHTVKKPACRLGSNQQF